MLKGSKPAFEGVGIAKSIVKYIFRVLAKTMNRQKVMHRISCILWFLTTLASSASAFAEPITVLLEKDGIDEELVGLYTSVDIRLLQTKFVKVRKNETPTDVLLRAGVIAERYDV